MKKRELYNLGIPGGEPIHLAIEAARKAAGLGMKKRDVRALIAAVAEAPKDHAEHDLVGALARSMIKTSTARARFVPRSNQRPTGRGDRTSTGLPCTRWRTRVVCRSRRLGR